MKKYNIPVTWVQAGLIQVNAESLNEAIDVLKHIDLCQTPVIGQTLENTMSISYRNLQKYSPDEYVTDKPKIYISSKTPDCPFCKKAIDFFKEYEIGYDEIDLSGDEDSRDYLMERTGSLGIPQIEIGNEILVGFDEETTQKLLEKYGIKST